MRLTPRLLLAASMLATPAAVSGQDEGQIGLGIGLEQLAVFADEDVGLLSLLSPQVYVPIMIGDGLMLEPSIGFIRTSQSQSSDFVDFESTFTFLRLGAGLLWVVKPAERGRIYAGPRVGILRMSSEVETDDNQESESRMDLMLAGVVGGEFFLLPAFSLGGEVGLEYTRIGDDEDEPEGMDSDASLLAIGTEFRVRWYID